MSKKITQLPEITTAADAALLPVVEAGVTSQVTKANLLKELTVSVVAITTLLNSDDVSLDELQEIVDFIKANKDDLDSLSVGNIAGLQAALDGKAAAVHNHDSAYYTKTATDALLAAKAALSHTHAIAAITGLQDALNAKAAATHTHTAAEVGLSNVINTLQLVAADIENTLTSASTTKPLSANQGKVLKGLIDNINTLLSSDETNLDTLQEIVDFIELNKSTLDALSIGSISGLQAALDGKADSVHSHAIGDTSGLQAALDAKAAAAHSHSNASTGAAGFMSAADKSKLDDVEADATADQTATEIETAYNSRVSVVSQAEAEAGDATTVRRWTAQRIKQAIAALAGGGGGVYDYIEVAQATPQNFGGSNLTETVAAWDAAVSDAGTGNFSHSTTVNNERITVNADGRYRVQATLSRTQGGSARTSYQVFLRKNGSDVFKGISINYSRGSAYGDASNNFDTEIDLVDGDYIEIVNKIGDTDGTYTSNSIPARLQFIMTKLS